MLRFIRLIFLFCLATASSVLLSAQVTFTQTMIQTNGSFPSGTVAADFNNDGILDLVTVNGNNTLSFYKGLGGGQYAAPISQPLPNGGTQVVAGDFSRHGTPDLAIVSGNITILIGNNDGTFKTGSTINVNGTAQSITLADFNGDHLPDIAASICPASGPCVSKVYLGQGNGTFAWTTTMPDGGGQIVSGDFNADGHQDVAVIAGNEVALYLGKGTGQFNTPLLASVNGVSSIAVGDFYNNRIQSLVALAGAFLGGGNFENWIYSLRYSNGNLLVENQRVLQASGGAPYQVLAAGDLNGDFKDDLFVGGGDTFIAMANYLLGNGNGTFGALSSDISNGAIPQFPFIRDLSGDSRHDIAASWFTVPGGGDGVETWINTNATTNCSLPPANQLVVHICAPSSGQVVGQTFTFKGSGSALNGIAKRMELWIDGKKVAQNLEDQFKATVTLTRGNHVASFVVVDTFDEHVSGSVSFTASF
jgi:hypothetical protein